MKKMLLSLLAVCLYPAMCFAGPFGTSMGDPIEKFPDVIKQDNGEYISTKMPNPNSSFEFYTLSFAASGLYQVTAFSEVTPNDSFGFTTRMLFNKLKEQLTSKYGQPKCAEGLMDGATWVEEKDFIMSILKNERLHICGWSGKTLSDSLNEVIMMISASGPSSSSVLLNYKYKNSIDAQRQKDISEKNSL